MSEEIGRILLVFGAVLVAAGGLLLLAGKFGIGRLPGDLMWEGENWTVYVPLGWMVVLSVVFTVLLNLFGGSR